MLSYTDKQKEAIALCVDIEQRIVGITGAAGTGKTTIMRDAFYELTQKVVNGKELTVGLCAPTGKAAKRISEATGIPAVTIHRLLEFPKPGETNEEDGKPQQSHLPMRSAKRPLEYKVVLVDESAMISNELWRFLIDALPPGGAIRLFGDVNQLPPIEKMDQKLELSPFQRVLKTRPSVVLDAVHRQALDSGILFNANRILRGHPPVPRGDFDMIVTDKPIDKLQILCDTVDFGALDNQIISPTNKGWVGVHQLNERLKSKINPRPDPNDWLTLPRNEWDHKDGRTMLNVAIGDKVVYCINNYDLNIFNGEVGKIIAVDTDQGDVTIDFGDRITKIPPSAQLRTRYGSMISVDPRKAIELAYVLSTHKCQGSEYKHVAYVMNRSRSFNLNRNNFYTAVTRSREKVYVISDSYSIKKAIGTRGS